MVLKYTILILYFGILFLIGIFASKKIKDIKDYYVGGKKLGFWVVAFSSRATGESAWLLLGLTGLGAVAGYSAFWVVVGELFGVGIAWFLMAKPFKRMSDEYNSITIPDFLVSRFQTKSHLLRIIAAFTLTVFVTIYVSAQIDATGSAFENFLGWNYYTGAIVGFFIVIVYIFIGGFVAVAWSDFFQGSLMLFGLVFLPFIAYLQVGGVTPALPSLAEIDPSLTTIWGTPPGEPLTWLTLMTILSYLLIGIGFLGSPQIFVRFMSIKGQAEIKKGRWVALIFTLLADGGAVCIGILARMYFTKQGQDVGEVMGNGGQDALPMLVEQVMPLAIVGLFIAAVLAAIMSTIDSLLVVASSALVRDFYQKIRRPDVDPERLTRISRFATLLLAGIALLLAMSVSILSPERTIFWFVIFGYSGIACTFCPMMILAISWKRYNVSGAIASMVIGFAGVPFFKFVAPQIPEAGPYFANLSELPPAFLTAFIAGIAVTLVTTRGKKAGHASAG